MAMDSSLCVESIVLMMPQNFCMKNFSLLLCSSVFSATSNATWKMIVEEVFSRGIWILEYIISGSISNLLLYNDTFVELKITIFLLTLNFDLWAQKVYLLELLTEEYFVELFVKICLLQQQRTGL